MTQSQFEALIARYGPAVDNWPPQTVTDALDLLQSSTVAQDLFAKASLEDAPSARPSPRRGGNALSAD